MRLAPRSAAYDRAFSTVNELAHHAVPMKASGRLKSGASVTPRPPPRRFPAMLPLYGIKGVNGPSRGGRAGATASMPELRAFSSYEGLQSGMREFTNRASYSFGS